MADQLPALTPQGYVEPGAYVAEIISPNGVNLTAATRIPTMIGRGSPYIRRTNQAIRRAYRSDIALSFSATSPHIATLDVASNGSKQVSKLIDQKGIEVRSDLWLYSADGSQVTIADAAFVPGNTYTLSYQSASVAIGDAMPVAGIRMLDAVGSVLGQAQYKRNVDFYLSSAILPPAAKLDADGAVVQWTKSESALTPIVKTAGAGNALPVLNTYADFNHAYSRDYRLEVLAVDTTEVTVAWYATPVAQGNESAVAVPLCSQIAAPTFLVDTADAQTLTVDLEFGIRVDFPAVGTFAVGDVFTFSALGASSVEVQSAFLNTNQFAAATDVIPGVSNVGTGSLSVDASAYTGTHNTQFVARVIDVDPGTAVASVPVGSVDFTANPVDGQAFLLDNGLSGANRKVTAFEFTSTGVRKVAGSVLVTLAKTAAANHTGLLSFVGSATAVPGDGDIITINDSVGTYAFEFDTDGVLRNPAARRVVIATGASAGSDTIANFLTALAASPCLVTGTNTSGSYAGVGHAALQATPNLTVTVTVSKASVNVGTEIVVDPVDGGSLAQDNIVQTAANLAAAINTANQGIWATSGLGLVAGTYSVKLVHGTRIALSAVPGDGDAVTVGDGVSEIVFTYRTSPTLPEDVAIGGTAAASATNLAAKIRSSALKATVGQLGATLVVTHEFGRAILATSADFTVTPAVVNRPEALNNGNAALTVYNTLTGATLVGMAGGMDAVDAPDQVTVAWGTSGDAFAGGVFTASETDLASKTYPLYEGVGVKLASAIATAAQGSVVLEAVAAANDTVVLDDGVNAPKTFTYKVTPALSGDVAIGSTAAICAENLKAAILASGLLFTATRSGNTVSITHTRTGSGPANAYNTAIVATSPTGAITAVGMVGGGNNYAVGDSFAFSVLAPRRFATALDTRDVDLTVYALNQSGTVSIQYAANTAEGGFGITTADAQGFFTLPGQIGLVLRNTNRFAVGDKFEASYVNNEVLYWDLDKKMHNVFTANDVLVDRNGSVTGVFGAYYIALAAAPLSKYPVVATISGAAFTKYTLLGGNIVRLLIASPAELTASLVFDYVGAGSEPSLGSTYYVSGNFVRPDSMYNKLYVFTDRNEAANHLAPMVADNDLAIGNELAWSQVNKPEAVGFIQVKDSDNDGVLSPADVTAALEAYAHVKGITEFCGLRLGGFLSTVMAYDEQGQDPFQKRAHIAWYGFPIGTPVGSETVEDSLVYLAQNTLQPRGNSLTHGRRVMVGHVEATKTITNYDGSTALVTLDGSFINAAAMVLFAARPNNSTDILKMNLLGFDSIKTYGDEDNAKLGEAGVIYLKPNGTGVYSFGEDTTIDTSDPEYSNLLGTGTKLDVERIVTAQMDEGLTGVVPDTKAGGVSLVRTRLYNILEGLVANSTIPPYQDDSGNVRAISDNDILVIQDPNRADSYDFYYMFFTRTPIKRMFGMYSANRNLFLG